jgi:hypothetical protein
MERLDSNLLFRWLVGLGGTEEPAGRGRERAQGAERRRRGQIRRLRGAGGRGRDARVDPRLSSPHTRCRPGLRHPGLHRDSPPSGGVARVGWMFTLTAAAYTLVRICSPWRRVIERRCAGAKERRARCSRALPSCAYGPHIATSAAPLRGNPSGCSSSGPGVSLSRRSTSSRACRRRLRWRIWCAS